MRSALGKECRKLFWEMMAAEFPEFHEDKGQIVPPGMYVWTSEHSPGVWFHIVLIINPKYDKFTIEAGWSFDGKLPGVAYGGPKEILERPEICRMNFIWSRRDYWWMMVLRPEEYDRVGMYKDDPIEQCVPLVAPAVFDAADKLKEHMAPLFDQIGKRHGRGSASAG